jgi:hypothetical protein
MAGIILDLNNPLFQNNWFALERQEALAVVATLRKIRHMEWDQLYRDKGLRWEAILSRDGPNRQRLYSLRITQRARAVACREGNALRLLAIHADHDSTYDAR